MAIKMEDKSSTEVAFFLYKYILTYTKVIIYDNIS